MRTGATRTATCSVSHIEVPPLAWPSRNVRVPLRHCKWFRLHRFSSPSELGRGSTRGFRAVRVEGGHRLFPHCGYFSGARLLAVLPCDRSRCFRPGRMDLARSTLWSVFPHAPPRASSTTHRLAHDTRSDFNGKLVRFLHPDGADVAEGEPYVELEATPGAFAGPWVVHQDADEGV